MAMCFARFNRRLSKAHHANSHGLARNLAVALTFISKLVENVFKKRFFGVLDLARHCMRCRTQPRTCESRRLRLSRLLKCCGIDWEMACLSSIILAGTWTPENRTAGGCSQLLAITVFLLSAQSPGRERQRVEQDIQIAQRTL